MENNAPERKTQNSKLKTSNPKPETQNLKPETQNPKLETQNPKPETQNLKPETQNLKPETQNLKPETQNLKPETQNLKPETQNLKPETQNLKPKIIWPTFTIILLIACFFRFYRIGDYPLGIFFDPVINALDAIRLVERGGPVIFFPTNGGREAFFIYLLIPYIWNFGTTAFSIRLLTATIGLLNVALLIGFLRDVPKLGLIPGPKPPLNPPQRRENPIASPPLGEVRGGPQIETRWTTSQYRFWLAALGGLALATSYWHMVITRLGQRPILVPMLSVPLFWFFLKGWATGQRRWFILAGIFMGLEGYTYSAARLLPLILALALLPEFLPFLSGKRIALKHHLINLSIFGLAALIVYLPMAGYLLTHPAQFTARAFSVMVWNFLDTPAEIVAELGRNLVRVGAFFCCDGSANVIFGLPHYPGSHPLVFPFLLAGLAGSLKNWRHLFPRLVSLWWIIGLIPSVIAIEAPHPLRMIVAVVPTAILIALGPIYLAQWLAWLRPNIVPARLLIIAIPFIIIPVIDNFPAYFHDWTAIQATRGAYDYAAVAIRDAILQRAGEGRPIYLPLSRFNTPPLLYYLSDAYPRRAQLSAVAGDSALVISPERSVDDATWVRLRDGAATLLPPLTAKGQQAVQSAFSQAGAAEPVATADGEIIARLVELPVDPAQFVETVSQPLDASFGPLRLTGATLPPAIDPDADLPVTLFWQANQQTANEYEVLVRLVDDSRRSWGNGDARPTDWVYPTSFWRPAIDEIAAQHVIALESSPPPGRYWLAVSVFDPALGQRLPLTGGASDSPDTFFVGPLKVPLSNSSDATQVSAISTVTFGEQIQLFGAMVEPDTVAPGESLQVNLRWHAMIAPKQDYTVFVHLLDDDDTLLAGNDSQPLNGRYPTTIWSAGETIVDTHSLTIPADLAPGRYRVAIGLYHQPSGSRLPLHLSDGQINLEGRLVLADRVEVEN